MVWGKNYTVNYNNESISRINTKFNKNRTLAIKLKLTTNFPAYLGNIIILLISTSKGIETCMLCTYSVYLLFLKTFLIWMDFL